MDNQYNLVLAAVYFIFFQVSLHFQILTPVSHKTNGTQNHIFVLMLFKIEQ